MTLTRRDIARRLRDANSSLGHDQAAASVDAVLQSMRRALGAGSKLMVSGFGTFEVRQRAQRRGVDPSTGKPLVIRARRVVGFRAAPALLQAIDPDD